MLMHERYAAVTTHNFLQHPGYLREAVQSATNKLCMRVPCSHCVACHPPAPSPAAQPPLPPPLQSLCLAQRLCLPRPWTCCRCHHLRPCCRPCTSRSARWTGCTGRLGARMGLGTASKGGAGVGECRVRHDRRVNQRECHRPLQSMQPEGGLSHCYRLRHNFEGPLSMRRLRAGPPACTAPASPASPAPNSSRRICTSLLPAARSTDGLLTKRAAAFRLLLLQGDAG